MKLGLSHLSRLSHRQPFFTTNAPGRDPKLLGLEQALTDEFQFAPPTIRASHVEKHFPIAVIDGCCFSERCHGTLRITLSQCLPRAAQPPMNTPVIPKT